MVIGVYDGTFAGLLTLCAELFRRQVVPEAISTENGGDGLFDHLITVSTDDDRAARFADRVVERTDTATLRYAYHAFLSEAPEAAIAIFRYLARGRNAGKGLNRLLADRDVFPVHRLARKVCREAHRMLGFVRFSEVSPGLYYAGIETDAFILPLIAAHFADRFATQNWIVHDVKRGRALMGNVSSVDLVDMEVTAAPVGTEPERAFLDMWRRYFIEAAVPERRNAALQNGKVPQKYRRFLSEFNGVGDPR